MYNVKFQKLINIKYIAVRYMTLFYIMYIINDKKFLLYNVHEFIKFMVHYIVKK